MFRIRSSLSILLALFCLLNLPLRAAAQDACTPSNDDDDACQGLFGIDMQLRYPLWLEAYPNANAALVTFLNAALRDHLTLMVESPYDYTFTSRMMGFGLNYRTVVHSETLVSLVYTQWADYGGLYPVDSLITFTFDLAADRVVALADLFRPGVDPERLLRPRIDAQVDPGEQELVGEIDVFAVSPDALILFFPSERSGPAHAGMVQITIPLDDLTADLNPELFRR